MKTPLYRPCAWQRTVITAIAVVCTACVASVACEASAASGAVQNKEFDKSISAFCAHQRNAQTGLFDSFINTSDELLVGQASTYDQALVGLGLLKFKEYYQAKQLLNFFKSRFGSQGLCNFYDTSSGACGVETTIHLGPNAWIALFALNYSQETGDESFYSFARDIGLWAADLKHYYGAISMGPCEDWGGNWDQAVSLEQNIVAYAMFRSLYVQEKDEKIKSVFARQMQGIRKFINEKALVRDKKNNIIHISVGYNLSEGVSPVPATDVVSMLLLVFNPQELREFFGISETQLFSFAKDKFFVSTDGMKGYDFTDKKTCGIISRPRMISLEWSAQMADALMYLCRFYETHPGLEAMRFDVIGHRAQVRGLTSHLDRKKIITGTYACYPYATKDAVQVFPFTMWWKTPAGDPQRCGALSSTMWRFFLYKEWNPLDLRETTDN